MFRNGFYNLLGSVLRLGISLLTIPVLIRLIGIEEYGLWILVSTVLGVASLAEGGLSTSTTVFLSQDLANDDTKGISQTLTITTVGMLCVATLAALLLFIFSGVIIDFFKDFTLLQRLVAISSLQVSALVLWARLLQQILVGVEQSYKRYDLMNILNTIQIILINLGMIGIAWLGGRTLSLMKWHALICMIMLLVHGIAVTRLINISTLKPSWCRSKSVIILHYCSSTWMTALGGAFFTQGDRLIVGGMLGNKLLGIYAAITSITVQINSFSALAIQPLLPEIGRLYYGADQNQNEIKQKIKKSFQINAILALGVGGSLLTLTPIILRFLIPGPISEENNFYFRIATIVYSIYSTNAVGYYILLGLKMPNITLIVQILCGSAALILIAYLTKIMGLQGALLGNSAYVGTWSLNVLAMKKLKIPFNIWVKWITPSFLWFFGVVLLNFTLNIQSVFWLSIILIIQSMFVVIEFLKFRTT